MVAQRRDGWARSWPQYLVEPLNSLRDPLRNTGALDLSPWPPVGYLVLKKMRPAHTRWPCFWFG